MRTLLAAAVALAAAAPLAAQAPARDKLPAEERLAYFVGDWRFEGTSETTPMGPGGPMTNDESCTWFAGGYQLVCESSGTSPRGKGTARAVMAYDPARQVYTYYAINSFGESYFVDGTVDGKTWTWTAEAMIEGSPMKYRVTVDEEGPDRYTFRMEGAFGDAPMALLESGTATRRK